MMDCRDLLERTQDIAIARGDKIIAIQQKCLEEYQRSGQHSVFAREIMRMISARSNGKTEEV